MSLVGNHMHAFVFVLSHFTLGPFDDVFRNLWLETSLDVPLVYLPSLMSPELC